MSKNYFCQCCGFNTVDSTYEICPICNWEDDPVQNTDPLCRIGANKISLFEAQQKILKKLPISIITYELYIRDKNWKILEKKNLKISEINNGMDYFNASIN